MLISGKYLKVMTNANYFKVVEMVSSDSFRNPFIIEKNFKSDNLKSKNNAEDYFRKKLEEFSTKESGSPIISCYERSKNASYAIMLYTVKFCLGATYMMLIKGESF